MDKPVEIVDKPPTVWAVENSKTRNFFRRESEFITDFNKTNCKFSHGKNKLRM